MKLTIIPEHDVPRSVGLHLESDDGLHAYAIIPHRYPLEALVWEVNVMFGALEARRRHEPTIGAVMRVRGAGGEGAIVFAIDDETRECWFDGDDASAPGHPWDELEYTS